LRTLPSFAQRQLVLALLFFVTLTGVPLARLSVPSPPALTGAIATLLVTTAVAVFVPWRLLSTYWQILVPIGSMVAIGLLRAATGESASPYSFLIIAWALAMAPQAVSRWALVLIAAGCDFMVFMPYLVLEDPAPLSAGILLRALFTAVIATIAAVAVNELTRRVRLRMDELAENALGLQRARDVLSSVIDAVSEQSIIATDLDGVIEVFNPGAEKLLGIPGAAVVGTRRVTDFHLPEELATADDLGRSGFPALVATASTKLADVRDWTYVTADGREAIVHLTVASRYDRHGVAIGYLFMATDMTSAREVARLEAEFVSLISHELRTPLTSVLGYLELVLDDAESPVSEEQRKYLRIAERNALRLGQLVGDLLFTAQVEAGKITFDWHQVDLAAVITASVEAAIPAASVAGVTVATAMPTAPVLVEGDTLRLGQACDNLVSNAVKFTPQGGQVQVSLEVSPVEDGRGLQAIVTVADTGYGIAAAELESLFTRFYRATTATNNAVPGAGLGLAITRTIVNAHGGKMCVRSVEGTGSTFTFQLPLRQT